MSQFHNVSNFRKFSVNFLRCPEAGVGQVESMNGTSSARNSQCHSFFSLRSLASRLRCAPTTSHNSQFTNT